MHATGNLYLLAAQVCPLLSVKTRRRVISSCHQGINRGKCSCGECVEFVRGDGVLCGYCECAPVRHEKLTDPNSEVTQTAHDEQENQPRSSIWKDVSLGWIPDPKGDYTRFSNSLLAEFYQCFWATCPFKDNFRLEFTMERKRQ